MLSPYYMRLRSEIERFGGTVEKFIGDAVMAVFGAPVTHEDDPERAVRAALAAREAVQELNEANPALDLHVRIAVNTGEAVVALDARPSEGEGMVAGDVVNTAARLQSAAPVDGILVGETTYRATERIVEYRDCEPVRGEGEGRADPGVGSARGARPLRRRRRPARGSRARRARAGARPTPRGAGAGRAASGRRSSSRSWAFQASARAGSSGSSPKPSTRMPTGSSSGARDARSHTAKAWPSGLWRRSSRRRRASSRPTPRRPPRPSSSTLCRISSPTRARRAGSRHSCGAWSG